MEKDKITETLMLIRDVTYNKARKEEKEKTYGSDLYAERLYAQADTLNLVIDMMGDEEFHRGIRKFYEQYEKEDN